MSTEKIKAEIEKEIEKEIGDAFKKLKAQFSSRFLKINKAPSISDEDKDEIIFTSSVLMFNCFCYEAALISQLVLKGDKQIFIENAAECFDLAQKRQKTKATSKLN